ncbi:hypothetical protein MTO96_049004 [Rhipicephalus appendiculatus]
MGVRACGASHLSADSQKRPFGCSPAVLQLRRWKYIDLDFRPDVFALVKKGRRQHYETAVSGHRVKVPHSTDAGQTRTLHRKRSIALQFVVCFIARTRFVSALSFLSFLANPTNAYDCDPSLRTTLQHKHARVIERMTL